MTSSKNMKSNNFLVHIDPNHNMNCRRFIATTKTSNNEVILYGTDSNPHCSIDGSGISSWELTGIIDGNTISVDFTPKGGPKNVIGIYESDTDSNTNYIKWPDGNR